jgi:hypothetical protein
MNNAQLVDFHDVESYLKSRMRIGRISCTFALGGLAGRSHNGFLCQHLWWGERVAGALHFRRRHRSRPDFLSGCFLTGLTGLRRIAVVCDDARYYSGSGGKRSSRTCRDRHQSCKIL